MKAEKVYWVDTDNKVIDCDCTHTQYIWRIIRSKKQKTELEKQVLSNTIDARDYAIKQMNWMRITYYPNKLIVQMRPNDWGRLSKVLKVLPIRLGSSCYLADIDDGREFFANVSMRKLL
jgi:hypothetical protein